MRGVTRTEPCDIDELNISQLKAQLKCFLEMLCNMDMWMCSGHTILSGIGYHRSNVAVELLGNYFLQPFAARPINVMSRLHEKR